MNPIKSLQRFLGAMWFALKCALFLREEPDTYREHMLFWDGNLKVKK